MSKDPPQPPDPADLRHRAEKRLARPTKELASPESPPSTDRLVHELQVHQIELEMQNDELRDSRSQVEAALERYTDLYDFAPVGYFTLTRSGAIREVNLPGARLLGVERGRLSGDSLGPHISQETRPVFEAWLTAVFSTAIKQTCAVALIQANGQPPLEVEIEATLSVDQKEARAIVIDITARKVLEAQVRDAHKMEVVGQLAGGVAHEFNNILAAMLLNLEMLQMQQDLPPKTHSSLVDLGDLAKRAASLTRQLLLFSRRQAMFPRRLEINSALANFLQMMERLVGNNITCVRIPSPEELWVDADALMLDEAVLNLCLNARDAMPRGGTLTLETSLADFAPEGIPPYSDSRPGRFACLRVTDTGSGMDPEALKHLFEPFFSTKEVGHGSGLGLASTYGIVHQHQGWMNVDSAVDQGTSVSLYFPLSEEVTAPPPRLSQVFPSKDHVGTILVVEDEAALLHICAGALTMLGYQVLRATNSQEALDLWRHHGATIDLLLTDMRMPKSISGLELARKLHKIKPSLRIILMSGYSAEMSQDGSIADRIYTFLPKPFDLKSLAHIVGECLK